MFLLSFALQLLLLPIFWVFTPYTLSPNGPRVVCFVLHMLTPSIECHGPIYASLVSSSSVETPFYSVRSVRSVQSRGV